MEANNSGNNNNNGIEENGASSSSNNAMQRVPEQPRLPRNLQGLLRFAVEATKAEDAPGPSDFEGMSEERRRFLEVALETLTVDMSKVMYQAIKILSDTEKIHAIQLGMKMPSEVEQAFVTLGDIIDDIDIANSFYKMGGFSIFPVCYGCENESVRANASSILGEVCQNNDACQRRALEQGLLNLVINMADTENGVALVKCLYALSCMCRGCDAACEEAVAQGACAALVRRLTDDEPAARTKSAFFALFLITSYETAREQFVQLNAVAAVAKQLKQGLEESTEHMLGILLALVEFHDERVLRQCIDPANDLKNILEHHFSHPDMADDRREENAYCRHLLNRIFEKCPQIERTNVELADR